MDEFDFPLRDLTIVDGSMRPPYTGSIGAKGDKIAELGHVTGDAKDTIDGSGLAAMPGFIDSHRHAALLFVKKKEESLVSSG